MKSVLIANSNRAEIDEIGKVISPNYNVLAITTPKEMNGFLDKCDAILLDQNFTENSGIDFLMKVIEKSYLPILMVTPPDNSKCAIEALGLGAYNYLVKTDNYFELLDASIKEALSNFEERETMKETIIALKKRVAELEGNAGTHRVKEPQQPPQGTKSKLMQEITSRFKRGEVNLPAYPEINIKFREMMKQGANVSNISNLLKKDIGISSKLISISNSPYYRGLTENKTLEQAISRMGLTETKKYVSIISNRALYTVSDDTYSVFIKDLWQHSLSCGYAAEKLTEVLELKLQDDVFTMGLLHDIGKLMLIQIVAELEAGGAFEEGIDQTELFNILNEYQGNFGGALLKKWRFPEVYSKICLYHNNLQGAGAPSRVLFIINLANTIVKTMGFGREEPEDIDIGESVSFKFFKMNEEQIDEAKDHIEEMMENTTSM